MANTITTKDGTSIYCKVFPGRSHFLFAEPGWEEVADYAIQWASEHQWADAAELAAELLSARRESSVGGASPARDALR
jgi:hypothetical protein